MELKLNGTVRIKQRVDESMLNILRKVITDTGCDYSIFNDTPNKGDTTLQVYDYENELVNIFIYSTDEPDTNEEISEFPSELLNSLIDKLFNNKNLTDFWERAMSKDITKEAIFKSTNEVKLYCVTEIFNYLDCKVQYMQDDINEMSNSISQLLLKYTKLK